MAKKRFPTEQIVAILREVEKLPRKKKSYEVHPHDATEGMLYNRKVLAIVRSAAVSIKSVGWPKLLIQPIVKEKYRGR